MNGVRQPGARFCESDTGTTDGITLTRAAVEGKRHVITDIAVASDAETTVSIQDDDDTVWQMFLPADTPLVVSFSTPIYGSVGKAVKVVVAQSTSTCYANVNGITINN